MGRRPCCSKVGLNKGTWRLQEDKILTSYIKVHGEGNWRNLPKRAGLKRCGKSCRLRWLNYLTPNIKRGNISPDEEDLILRLHRLLGNRWSLIAGRLPGRTDNEIKNYWKTKFGKKTNPPYPQASQKGPSTATKVLKPLATKAIKFSTKYPLINMNAPPISKNFDLHHKEINAINYHDSNFPSFQRDDRVSTAYYSNERLDRYFDQFENNNYVHHPFPQRNLFSVEDFLMEDFVSNNVRSGGAYEINKNHKDMESLEMLNADEWL